MAIIHFFFVWGILYAASNNYYDNPENYYMYVAVLGAYAISMIGIYIWRIIKPQDITEIKEKLVTITIETNNDMFMPELFKWMTTFITVHHAAVIMATVYLLPEPNVILAMLFMAAYTLCGIITDKTLDRLYQKG